MKIRIARSTDRPKIAAVQTASWRDAYADVLPAEYLADSVEADLLHRWRGAEIGARDLVLIAEEENVLGFIAVWCRPDPFIDNLHVRPSARSAGIGTQLMRSAAQTLLRQGHQIAYLWVIEGNDRAIRFYERLGGHRVGRSEKDLFGNRVAVVKIAWEDLLHLAEYDSQ